MNIGHAVGMGSTLPWERDLFPAWDAGFPTLRTTFPCVRVRGAGLLHAVVALHPIPTDFKETGSN